jgi:hypothetical protein
MSDKRTVPEVLVDLENQVKILTATVASQDMLLKNILNRSNDIHKMFVELAQETSALDNQATNSMQNITNFPTPSPDVLSQIKVETEFKGNKRVSRTPPPETNPSQQKIPVNQGKVPIIQKLVDENNKIIFMADVEIYENNILVHKTKTNASGKYQALMKPGTYNVVFVKTDKLTKTKQRATTEIIVPDSKSHVELNTAVLKNV